MLVLVVVLSIENACGASPAAPQNVACPLGNLSVLVKPVPANPGACGAFLEELGEVLGASWSHVGTSRGVLGHS